MKVKAFTILETVVALVVSSLIIALVYQIYTVVLHQFQRYEWLQRETINFEQFHTVFNRDVSLCQYVKSVTDREVVLKFSEQDIRYNFEEYYAVRHHKITDTFHLQVKAVKWQPWSSEFKRAFETITIETKVLGRDLIVFEKKPLAVATEINNQFVE